MRLSVRENRDGRHGELGSGGEMRNESLLDGKLRLWKTKSKV